MAESNVSLQWPEAGVSKNSFNLKGGPRERESAICHNDVMESIASDRKIKQNPTQYCFYFKVSNTIE